MKFKFWQKEKRGSLENPSASLSDPSAWLQSWMGGEQTNSGTQVSSSSALTIPAVYAAVRVISESIASLPLCVYNSTDDGKDKLSGHIVSELLGKQPNTDMSAFTLREALMSHVLLWGNGYAEIQRNNRGDAVALWLLLPDRTHAVRRNGVKYYITRVNGENVMLNDADVLHLTGLTFDGLSGYSPITLMRESLGLGIAAEEYGARMFSNNARPGGILEHPGVLSVDAAERLKESWANIHQGLSNSHRVAILEEGLTWKQLSVSPEDAQFLETRKFQKGEVATMFNVPPHMIGDLEKATFSNIEHQSIQFVVHTIRPYLVRIEQEINRKLLGDGEFIQHTVDGLLRGDTKSRYDSYAIARQWGWMSVNDIRSLENMNDVDGGDTYLTPLNMSYVGEESPQDAPQEEQNFSPLIDAAIRRIEHREQDRISGLLSQDDAVNKIKTFLSDHRDYISGQLQPIADVAGKDVDTLNMVDGHIRTLSARIDSVIKLNKDERKEAWNEKRN